MPKPFLMSHSVPRSSPVRPNSTCPCILRFFVYFAYNMKNDQKVFKLRGKVQHYAWGGSVYLPRLMSLDNPDGRPFAEYWLGAHDKGPAEVEADRPMLLNDYIKAHPVETLGSYT